MATRPNVYAERLFNIVNKFQQYRISNDNLRKEMLATYSAAVAEDRVKELVESCAAEYAKTVDAVGALRATVMDRLRTWGVLNPSNINADARLLDGSFKLNADELRQLVDRNAHNATMLRMICDYAARNTDDDKRPLDTALDVPTVENKRAGYETMFNGALSMLASIYASPVQPSMMAAFLDADSAVSAAMYAKIGTGKEL